MRVTRTKKQIADDIETRTKVCTRCNVRKPFEDFWSVSRRVDGVHHTCTACQQEVAKTRKNKVRTKIQIANDIELQSKVCNGCGERLPFEDYYKDPKVRDGRYSICKKCNVTKASRDNILRKYGLTSNEYEELLSGGCEVCGSRDKLVVDHCHTSGRTRGCLCSSCNIALGLLNEDVGRMYELINYKLKQENT